MSTLIYSIAFVLFILFLEVQSSYYVYTYGSKTADEHCCLVRLGDEFCLAKPLTRSLVQVNKECQRLGANEKKKNYWNQIVRRLDVETSEKIGEKILLQLENSLEKNLLNNDLLCLSTTTNNIDLEKCFVQLTIKPKKKSKKGQNDTEEVNEDDKTQVVEITESIQVRQGHGLSVRQIYELNQTDFTPTTRRQRECWSWYRKNTKNILNRPTKLQKSCIPFDDEQKKCLEVLFYRKSDGERGDSLPIGSQLYCETDEQQTKLLGYHRRSEICFISHYQIYLEHKFTDFLSLADRKKNRDVLEFISNNTKLTNEFEADCRDRNTLDEIKELIEEEKKQQQQAKLIATEENLSADE